MRITTIAIVKVRNEFESENAASAITTSINPTTTAANTRCKVSLNVPPPDAKTSLECIGGQKKSMKPLKDMSAPTMRKFLSAEDNRIPMPNKIIRTL
jgi:hypothetical protein